MAVLGAALPMALLMTGCGTESESGSGTAQLAAAQGWTEPDHYVYTLHSECGERGGLGLFRITVREGEAVEVEDLRDDGYEEKQYEGEPLTIGELLTAAERATERGAEKVEIEVGEDQRPTSILIDYDARAIDDEVCYTMDDFAEE